MGGKFFLEHLQILNWFYSQCCESRPCALWVDKRFGVFEWMPLGKKQLVQEKHPDCPDS